jgi:hypothetical protein
MAFIPPPHPNTRPFTELEPPRDAGYVAAVAAWLGHVEAGRIGNTPPMSDESRAVVLANERLICGRQRSLVG